MRRRVRAALGDLGVLPALLPRRVHVYGCGANKTGTHSVAACFRAYRTAHEPDLARTARVATAYLGGGIANAEIDRALGRRDRQLWLEMDSSSINAILAPRLVELFPGARFILTVRDVVGWLDSNFDQVINHSPRGTPWECLNARRYRPDLYPYQPADAPLEARGLYSLASWLHHWTDHNRRVLDSVPGDRLLIVRTSELQSRVPEIAAFVGIPPGSLDVEKARSYVTEQKHGVLAELDRRYVEEMVHRYCGDLMARLFPEIDPAANSPPLS